MIGLYHKIGHGPGRLLLAFGQFTLQLDFVMPLTERLFNTRLRREDFSDKLNAPLETERGVVICLIYTRRNARRVHSTVSTATRASTTGNAAHTPGTPHTAVSASSTGGMTTTPRSSEMAKP